MNQKSYMPIQEFSRLTGIKRENLRFYDQIGLLSPEARGENGYRYYSRHQLNSAYLVSDLRNLGVGLEEIKQYSRQRTPKGMLSLFAQQEKRISAEIERLRGMRELMALRAAMAREALDHEEDAPRLVDRPRESIFLCPALTEHLDPDEGSIRSYDYAAGHGVNLSYPMGAVISQKNFEAGTPVSVRQYYFLVRRGGNAWKEAGRYAVAYERCDVWKSEAVCLKLLNFLRDQGLRTVGDVYGEILLDELSVQDPERYCIRVEVRVAGPGTPQPV